MNQKRYFSKSLTVRIVLALGSFAYAYAGADNATRIQPGAYFPECGPTAAVRQTVYQDANQVLEAPENPLAMLPPHIRHDPEVLRYLYSNGVELPEDVKEKYGERLENLPPQRPMFPHVRRNPMFVRYLKSMGLNRRGRDFYAG